MFIRDKHLFTLKSETSTVSLKAYFSSQESFDFLLHESIKY